MRGLKGRSLLLLEAGSHKRLLLSIGILACVVFGTADYFKEVSQKMLHWIASPTDGSESMIFGVPSWFWGITVFGFALFLWMLEYAYSLKQKLTPEIDVSFNPNAEGIVATRTEIYANGIKIRDDIANYVRLTLVSRSQKTIKGCAVFLTRLEKQLNSRGPFVEIPLGGALSLSPLPVDVFPRVPATVDFLKVGQFDNKLGGTVPWPFRLDGVFDDTATYRFNIEVVGNDIAKSIRVEINWPNKWDAISGRQV
jgi:hypothetical protein